MNRETLFLIPARGGSKGLDRKNLRPLAGVPLVAWAVRNAIRAARRAVPQGRRVVCSTDDAEIAEAARAWGAEVPFERPAELSGDRVSSEAVALHALDWFEARGVRFDTLVRVQPTSPLAVPEDLVDTMRLHAAGDGTPATTVVPARPPSWTYSLQQGRLVEVVPEPPGVVRRQDLPEYFALNGAVTVTTPDRLRKSGLLIEPGSLAHVMPAERGVDVDSEADLALCVSLLARRVVPAVGLGGRRFEVGGPCGVVAVVAGDDASRAAALRSAIAAGVDAGRGGGGPAGSAAGVDAVRVEGGPAAVAAAAAEAMGRVPLIAAADGIEQARRLAELSHAGLALPASAVEDRVEGVRAWLGERVLFLDCSSHPWERVVRLSDHLSDATGRSPVLLLEGASALSRLGLLRQAAAAPVGLHDDAARFAAAAVPAGAAVYQVPARQEHDLLRRAVDDVRRSGAPGTWGAD